jgi:hypothetical protein
MLFDFVRAAFASPKTACTDLSRRLRDGVSFSLARNPHTTARKSLAVRNTDFKLPDHNQAEEPYSLGDGC